MTAAPKDLLFSNPNLGSLLRRMKARYQLLMWTRRGRPLPPPHLVKQTIVSDHASRFGIHIFVESGTYLGDMVYAMKNRFQRLFSIELSQDLSQRAQCRFLRFPHITIMAGDSAQLLPEVLSNISERCLFWLDGHYSAGITAKGVSETPIMSELRAILAHKVPDHVILIDDARCFIGSHDYPTLEEVTDLITASGLPYAVTIVNDVICVCPEATPAPSGSTGPSAIET